MLMGVLVDIAKTLVKPLATRMLNPSISQLKESAITVAQVSGAVAGRLIVRAVSLCLKETLWLFDRSLADMTFGLKFSMTKGPEGHSKICR